MLPPMRRWFVLLMIVLLPLRATAGDFMSLGMALEGKPAAAAGMSPDCPMHLAATGTEPAGDEDGSPTTAGECGSCALCFPVAQAESLSAIGNLPLADARHAIGDDRFASAPALALRRPPRP